jgi:hypothetical protein
MRGLSQIGKTADDIEYDPIRLNSFKISGVRVQLTPETLRILANIVLDTFTLSPCRSGVPGLY